MRKINLSYLFVILYISLFQTFILGQVSDLEVGIDEKLGDYLPPDATFTTSEGDTVALGDLIDTPVLLALVYYECPGICSPLLTELGWVANKVDLIPVKDFKVITLSFDHHETPATSSKWKKNYLDGLNNEFPEDAWVFLTGDSLNIKKVTDAVGFYFRPDRDEFVHAGAVITISPKGKISRYLFGTKFNPFDVKMALLEAQSGKTSPTISKVLQFCFSYDPEGRTYTLNITRIIGSIMLLSIGIFLVVLLIKKKK
ncbi:MAG: SCO family protein [Melioribacteraceae bacterium]|nr:SCO family protein [Melioribacteraceae bacterium]